MTPLEMAERANYHLAQAELKTMNQAWVGANVHAQIAIGYATTLQALLTQGPWPGEGPNE
jgi:hypothetical protein